MSDEELAPELWSINPQLAPEDWEMWYQLLYRWSRKWPRNLLRTTYYDQHNSLRDLGISIPPQLKNLNSVIGWPAKAVDTLANRVRFDGFVTGSGEVDALGLDEILEANEFEIEFPQAVRSTLKHSCAFMSVSAGDPGLGEPELAIRFRSALWATGLWDHRRRGLSAALVVNEIDQEMWGYGQLIPISVTLFQQEKIIHCERPNSQSGWDVVEGPNTLHRVPVHMLTYHPDLDRPFGRSRISRTVMGLTDSAVRTLLRSEVASEFFTSPQRYVLGADDAAFMDKRGQPIPAWAATIGRILALTRDEDGNMPAVGQFQQMTMTPHNEQLTMLATQFSNETGVPLAQLGVLGSRIGASSPDAVASAEDQLVAEAESTIDMFDVALRGLVKDIIELRDGRLSDEAKTVQALFRRPDRPSAAALADASLKQVQAVPWLGETSVLLEQIGFTHAQIVRLQAERRAAVSSGMLQQLTTGDQGGVNVNPAGRPTASDQPAAGGGAGDQAAGPAVAPTAAGQPPAAP